MNALRRKRLIKVEALLSKARGLLEEIVSKEREAFENIPESLLRSGRGYHMRNVLDALEQGVDDIERIESLLEEARS